MPARDRPIRRTHRTIVRGWEGIRPNSATSGQHGYPGKYSGFISQDEIQFIARSGALFRNMRGAREQTSANEEQAALADQSYEREQLADLVGWVDGPHPVVSSWCNQVGYFVLRGHRGIAIQFNDGATCFYGETSTVLYDQLLAVSSKGRFVHQFLAQVDYKLIS